MLRKHNASVSCHGLAALIILSLACGGGGAEVSGGGGDGASSATSGAGEDALIRALKQYANERRQIAITFTNAGYMEYLQNWLWHVRDVGMDNYLVFALDEGAKAALDDLGANNFYDPSLHAVDPSATDFGSASFKSIVHLKPRLTSRVLELGYEVMLSDADCVFFVNPFHRDEVVSSPFSIMSDAQHGYSMGDNTYFVNSGFAFMKPTEPTKLFMREVVRLLESRPDKMDQDAFNTAIANWTRRFPQVPLELNIINPNKVANGWVYFMLQEQQRLEADEAQDLIMIHNNWADGQHGSTHVQKLFRFREHHMWRVEDDEHTSLGSRVGYMTYSLREGVIWPTVWDHVAALKSALAYAQILNRMLILPRISCGGSPTSAHFRCTQDSFLDIQALLREYPHVRESSFAESPLVSPDLISPEMTVRIQRSGEAVAVGGQSNEIVVESGPGGLDESQVRERFAGSEQIRLLHIKGLDGRSFDGFEHPVTQLYFDKAARRGIKESFLARQAANRIMQTYVRDSSCPALILPREGSNGMGECGAMCVDQVARALSGAGLKSECLVVVAGSLTGNDRGGGGMGKALDPLRRLFGKIMWIGEGELDFPVCDLWRLGSHYMLNWMELLIAVDMDTLITVKPRGDDAFDPMVQEALHQRSNGHEPQQVYQLDRDASTLNRIEQPRHCPCPEYPENKMLKDIGIEHHQMGLLGTAEECFRRASAMNPSDLQSYQLLANVLMASNKHSEAAKAYDDANRLAPDSLALINQGVSLQRAGKFSEAAEAYRMAIAIDPTRYEAHHNLAGCLQDMARPSDAIAHYARATEINPSFAASYSAMGTMLHSRGQHSEAVKALKAAVQLAPEDTQHHLDLGQVLHTAGRYDDEQEVYKKAIEVHPGLALAYSYLAASILSSYQRSIGYRSYGRVEEDWVYIGKAEALFNKSLEVDPACGLCHGQIGDMNKDAHRINKAIEHYTKSARLLSHMPTIFCNLVYTKMYGCDWSDYESDFARILALVSKEIEADVPPTHPCVQPLQANLYRPLTAVTMRAVTENYVKRLSLNAFGTTRPNVLPLPHALTLPAADKRLRIGYLSADFKDHPVAKRIQDIFSFHDRSRVRVTCYSLNRADGSQWLAKIKGSAERFHALDSMLESQGFSAVASHISGDYADVLINLAGHTRGNDEVTLIMALGPSPVQLMHEGYAGTMGGARHSAHVTDRISSPPDYALHYVEGLLYMPHCFFVNDHAQTYSSLAQDSITTRGEREKRLAYGSLPPSLASGFVMGAFNQVHKVDPGIFHSWIDTMRHVPNSHLWMIKIQSEDAHGNLRKQAVSLGVEAERIHVTQGYNEREHLFVKAAAHVFLDTPSYNAHSSGCDVLWAGLPLITIAGDKMASRVAASLVSTMGCGDTIARTEGEYAGMLTALGSKPAALARSRECVRQGKVSSPLFDTRKWVRDQERALHMASEVAMSRIQAGHTTELKLNLVVAEWSSEERNK